MAPRDPSDALVFFGMSGDLARKKIFPALYAMVKKGDLDVPVIGVASSQWTVDDLRTRARDSITQYGGGVDDEEAFEQLTGLLRYVDGNYNDAATFKELKKAARRLRSARRTTSRSRRACSRRWSRASGRRAAPKNARVIIEKPFGRDLAVGPGAQPGAPLGVPRAGHLPHRPLPRQGGDPEHPLLPVRQLVPRADLEPQLHAPGADHHGRGLRRAGPRASSTRRSARCATSSRTTCSRPSGCSRWSRPSAPASRSCATARSRCSRRWRRSSPTTSCAGSSRATATRTAWRPTPTSRPSPRCACTSTRGAGPGVPFYIRGGQEPAGHVHRGAGRAAPSADQRVLRVRADAARHQLLPLPAQPPHHDRRRACGSRRAGEGFTGDERRAVPLQRPSR